jgi:hypothetical protein
MWGGDMLIPLIALLIALLACTTAGAAEPVTAPKPAPVVIAKSLLPAKRLDLRIGNVRNYMMPNEYREALGMPDADKNTVVVEGNRELLPWKPDRPVPGGIVAPFWALAHPLQSWRLLVPDPKAPPPGPPDVVPPRVFRWGP